MKPLSQIASSVRPSATITIDTMVKTMIAEGHDVVGFGAGEPDFNTPLAIKKAGIAAIQANKTRYTAAPGIIALRQAICDSVWDDYKVKYQPSDVVVSSGAKHALSQVIACLCNPGDEVILPAPYWVSYYEMVVLAGAKPVVVETTAEERFCLTADALRNAVTENTKLIILNTPSNPTGMVYRHADLEAIAEVAEEHDLYIISDEIYDKLVYDGAAFTSLPSLGKDVQSRTILINGMSKTYAMTGWRIGWACCPPHIAKVLSAYQSHAASSPSSISQEAALAAIRAGTRTEVEHMRKEFETRRDFFVDRVKDIPGIGYLKPDGAFYMMLDVSSFFGKEIGGAQIDSADAFATALLDQQRVAVVPCESFGAPNHIRMSYAVSKGTIEKGLERLKVFVNG